MSLSPFRQNTGLTNTDRRNAMMDRARDLRNRADGLLDYEEKLRNSEANLNSRESTVTTREAKLAARERRLDAYERRLDERDRGERQVERDEQNAVEAERLARDIGGDVVDRAFGTGDRAALVQAVFAARNKALGLTLPDRPTHPVARHAIELYEKLTGLTDDTPAPTGLAAQALAAARKAGLNR